MQIYNALTALVGNEVEGEELFDHFSNGALGRDGCIYVLADLGQILQIDTVNNSHRFVKNSIQSGRDDHDYGWGDAILGIDGCIYWPPSDARRTLKEYDPHSKQTSLVGDDFGSKEFKWNTGALATDGVIYCISYDVNRVLAIDPIGAFLATTKVNMQKHPEDLGYLFQTIKADEDSEEESDDKDSDDDDSDEDSDEDSILSWTNFDLAVVKFGQNTVFEVLEKAMKPVNDYCKESNLCPFMIAASCKDSHLCVVNHLLRRDLSWVNNYISSLEHNAPKNKK